MGLADDLVAKFAKAVNAKNDTKNTSGTKLQGTIHFKDDKPYVKLDGSDILTPVQLTANVIENERVTVTIKDHMAIVDGNLSSPAARTADVDEVRSQIQTIKDRRRSVYYQDEVPTEGTYEEGDIWFETDAGNKMHYYEDGEWVEAQFDSEAIAPKAITTEKIDAKAVRAAQIDVKDLFAQDIEASGTIMGGKFVSIPVKCWGGFTYDDLEVIDRWVNGDPFESYINDNAIPYLDVNCDGVVDMTDYGLIQEWLNGNTDYINSDYFEKESIYNCLCQFKIDTSNLDNSICLFIDRSMYGLENVEIVGIGQNGIKTPQLDAERANIGELEVPLANIYTLKVATLAKDPNQPIHPILIASDLQIDENVSIEKDLYVIGKLEGKIINARQGVNIPLLADNSGDTMVATPTAGTVDIGSTDKGITDVLTNYKSFIGSIHTKDAWNNIISTRHRNGASDGVSHGMYLRSLMNRSTPDLTWAVQAAGTWQSERAILDSGNYSNYTVPKTGGTFTGDVTFNNAIVGNSEYNVLFYDYYVFHTADGAGKAGYWKLCTINITGTYAGAPILFYMTSRYGVGKVAITFNGTTDVSAYSLNSFSRESDINSCYVVKTSGTSSGSVFDIYVKKEEAWGNLTVNHLEFPKYMRDLVTITWSGAYTSSVPRGAAEATAYTVLNTTNYSSNIPAATQSAVGLMSAADKKKLDGIATGANKITVDGAMSTSSTNPVQNKVVKSQLPTSNQNATNGYIRFPSAKIQVAWIKKSVSTTITTPWGGLYENASPISIGNWAAAFSSVPAISYNVYISSGDAADTGVNSFSPPTTTSAGSVYLNRGTALSISRTYTVTAIGIGTYA